MDKVGAQRCAIAMHLVRMRYANRGAVLCQAAGTLIDCRRPKQAGAQLSNNAQTYSLATTQPTGHKPPATD